MIAYFRIRDFYTHDSVAHREGQGCRLTPLKELVNDFFYVNLYEYLFNSILTNFSAIQINLLILFTLKLKRHMRISSRLNPKNYAIRTYKLIPRKMKNN
jgi:hypothetical protein